MNTVVCKDCVYSFVKNSSDKNRRCNQSDDIEIRYVKECPLSYSEKDIEWVEQKEKEDRERGYTLYTVTTECTICDEEV